jgi:beta-lactamase superfamily II metal-dependent hydrolase
MGIIKSHSVGNGDMFYIDHDSDNFTIIDCCLNEDDDDAILDEIAELDGDSGIVRFVSTHPDEDHIRGLARLDDRIKIVNFYCVKNSATKEDETESFLRYCELRDSSKAFYIEKDCSRRWMNRKSDERGSSGINILWPDRANKYFKQALEDANAGNSPNNISAIVKYTREGMKRAVAIWMGDLETDFLENIEAAVDLPKVSLLFAPHHGRDSGKVPASMLETMSPQIVIIGEAPSKHLHYYDGYNTITQNSAGDLIFDCHDDEIDIFTSFDYEVAFLVDRHRSRDGYNYIGTLVSAK